ncbi:radical SAM/SPASM domain-containing protein [Niallia sp.]|uniref:radical SAM/SPASM domain-containing protein n=1 Tax=Niallia sp. TaxID=2837523 RepID=UPI0028980632|nr:radical SAM protein [Niallia sp.]
MFNRDSNQLNKIKNLKLKPSRFNVLVNKENYLKLYNSYTGKIVKFNKLDKDKVKSILQQKEISINEKNDIVDFLSDQYFLVKNDIDEFRMAAFSKSTSLSEDRTLNLIVMPNEDCNFRCVYCYEDFEKSEMVNEVQENLVQYIEKNISKYNRLLISWFGGEPLISFEVVKNLSKRIMKICKEHNVEYSAGITTNGSKLTMDVFKELLSLNVRSYQITLDGLAETHDKSRIGRNGEKTFDTIINNLINIKNSNYVGFNIILRSNVSQETHDIMSEYIEFISDNFMNDDRFLLHFVAISNLKGEDNSNIHLCDTKDLFQYYHMAKEKGFNFNFYKSNLQPGGSECYASDPNSFVIGSDGMVYKCTVAFNNPANHVGDLCENGEMKIYNERLALWITGGANEDSSCTKCYFRPSCQGNACPLERIEANKTPCPPIKKNIKKYLDLVEEDLIYG